MTNRLAVVLATLIATGLVLDLILGLGWATYLARRFIELVEWLSFWR